MDGVGISIIERPRPLHNHDTPNPTHHTYTLKYEEPVKSPEEMFIASEYARLVAKGYISEDE